MPSPICLPLHFLFMFFCSAHSFPLMNHPAHPCPSFPMVPSTPHVPYSALLPLSFPGVTTLSLWFPRPCCALSTLSLPPPPPPRPPQPDPAAVCAVCRKPRRAFSHHSEQCPGSNVSTLCHAQGTGKSPHGSHSMSSLLVTLPCVSRASLEACGDTGEPVPKSAGIPHSDRGSG